MGSEPLDKKDRQRLEKEWLERVRQARSSYEKSSAAYQRAKRTGGGRNDSERARALRWAADDELAALEKYLRALNIFVGLLEHGRRPPDYFDSEERHGFRVSAVKPNS